MAVKPINELAPRTPSATDVLAVADPFNGQTGKSTTTQVVKAGLPPYNPATDGGKALKIKADGSGFEWV